MSRLAVKPTIRKTNPVTGRTERQNLGDHNLGVFLNRMESAVTDAKATGKDRPAVQSMAVSTGGTVGARYVQAVSQAVTVAQERAKRLALVTAHIADIEASIKAKLGE